MLPTNVFPSQDRDLSCGGGERLHDEYMIKSGNVIKNARNYADSNKLLEMKNNDLLYLSLTGLSALPY